MNNQEGNGYRLESCYSHLIGKQSGRSVAHIHITIQHAKVGYKSRHKNSYCKFGKFRENFNFANSVKRHIRRVSNSRLGHELTTSFNDRLISTFREVCFYFHETSHISVVCE